MGKAAPSKGTIDEQLATLKKQLETFLEEVRLIRVLEAQHEPSEAESASDAPSIEQLTEVIRELRDSIAETLISREAQRFDAMKRRVAALERTIQQTEVERRFAQESLRGAARQPAREPTMKAPTPPSPIDYTPVLTAAIETVRDLGLCLLQRDQPPAQKEQPKETESPPG